jgi:DNA-binding NarL/FixJ family response regulator
VPDGCCGGSLAGYWPRLGVSVAGRVRILRRGVHQHVRAPSNRSQAQARQGVVVNDEALQGELEVMRLVAQGHKDVAIARRLGVAPVTVRRRAQRFCRRVGARNRAQAIAIAAANRWLDEPARGPDDAEG